jgi:hypothetical protein
MVPVDPLDDLDAIRLVIPRLMTSAMRCSRSSVQIREPGLSPS